MNMEYILNYQVPATTSPGLPLSARRLIDFYQSLFQRIFMSRSGGIPIAPIYD